jgi:hypothetical protein
LNPALNDLRRGQQTGSEIQRETDGSLDAFKGPWTEAGDALPEGFDRKGSDLIAFHPPVAIQT